MVEYPIIFRISHAVRCAKLEALVQAEGRFVMAFEDDCWWCHEVEPGAFSVDGEGPFVAFERFRLNFRHAFDDLAEGSQSFEQFRREAEMFEGWNRN